MLSPSLSPGAAPRPPPPAGSRRPSPAAASPSAVVCPRAKPAWRGGRGERARRRVGSPHWGRGRRRGAQRASGGRRSRARVGWGVPTGPRPPRPLVCPPSSGAASQARRPGSAPHPSPVRSAATRGLPGHAERDRGDKDAPFSRNCGGGPGSGPRPGEQRHWSQAQGLGRHWGARRGLAEPAGAAGWARASGDRLCVARKKDGRPAGTRLDLEQGQLPPSLPEPAEEFRALFARS
nr:uncharacterized protein LOC109729884 [Microcebus murinus]